MERASVSVGVKVDCSALFRASAYWASDFVASGSRLGTKTADRFAKWDFKTAKINHNFASTMFKKP